MDWILVALANLRGAKKHGAAVLLSIDASQNDYLMRNRIAYSLT